MKNSIQRNSHHFRRIRRFIFVKFVMGYMRTHSEKTIKSQAQAKAPNNNSLFLYFFLENRWKITRWKILKTPIRFFLSTFSKNFLCLASLRTWIEESGTTQKTRNKRWYSFHFERAIIYIWMTKRPTINGPRPFGISVSCAGRWHVKESIIK